MTRPAPFTPSARRRPAMPGFDAFYAGWVAAIDKGDRDAIVDVFAEDGIYRPDGQSEARSHAAIAALWDRLLALPGFAVHAFFWKRIGHTWKMALDIDTLDERHR